MKVQPSDRPPSHIPSKPPAYGAGMKSLAISVPDDDRTNAHYRARAGDVVSALEEKAKMFAGMGMPAGDGDAFSEAMAPYLADPFRGTVRRRILEPGRKALDLELTAARAALRAAAMSPGDVELLIASSFLPDQVGVGNAVFLARELGMHGAAWNLETACSSSIVGFETAAALVQSGQYANVLVTASCTYSRVLDERNPMAWQVGDGAGAFVVGRVAAHDGFLGKKVVNTASTCGAFFYELALDAGTPVVRMGADSDAGKLLRDASEVCLRECTEGALRNAGLRLQDIDWFVFNTPMAWFVEFAVRVLRFDRARTLDTYPFVANAGPALMPINLFLAANGANIRPGDRVLLYSMGGVSSAAAVILRWGEVALGPAVPGWPPTPLG
jgi:3-oxoacyl-[acyl-carrier-protein] synthase-3